MPRTGPRTPDRFAISNRNDVSHGRCNAPVGGRDEALASCQALHDILTSLQPEDDLETGRAGIHGSTEK